MSGRPGPAGGERRAPRRTAAFRPVPRSAFPDSSGSTAMASVRCSTAAPRSPPSRPCSCCPSSTSHGGVPNSMRWIPRCANRVSNMSARCAARSLQCPQTAIVAAIFSGQVRERARILEVGRERSAGGGVEPVRSPVSRGHLVAVGGSRRGADSLSGQSGTMRVQSPTCFSASGLARSATGVAPAPGQRRRRQRIVKILIVEDELARQSFICAAVRSTAPCWRTGLFGRLCGGWRRTGLASCTNRRL